MRRGHLLWAGMRVRGRDNLAKALSDSCNRTLMIQFASLAVLFASSSSLAAPRGRELK